MSIKILPVRFTENGFMTRPFALGGEGAEGLDPAVKYRSCLQNWVIDTGNYVNVNLPVMEKFAAQVKKHPIIFALFFHN